MPRYRKTVGRWKFGKPKYRLFTQGPARGISSPFPFFAHRTLAQVFRDQKLERQINARPKRAASFTSSSFQ